MKWPECYRCIIFSSFRALHVESVTAGAPPRKRCMDFWERLPSPCSSSIAEQPVNVYRVYFLVVFFFLSLSFVSFPPKQTWLNLTLQWLAFAILVRDPSV